MQKALERANLSPAARRVIELRIEGAHAAAAKLETMRDWRNADGRVRGTFRFHGASTGRWTSFGIQTQNLKRPVVEDLGAAIEAVATGDLDHCVSCYAQPMSVVGDTARAIFRAVAWSPIDHGRFLRRRKPHHGVGVGPTVEARSMGKVRPHSKTRRTSPIASSGTNLDCMASKQGRSGKRRTSPSATWARRAPGENSLHPMTHRHRHRSSSGN